MRKKAMEATTMEEKRIPAIEIRDPETEQVKFTLDFNRKTVQLAERSGFRCDAIGDFPATGCSDLFFWGLQMHHRNIRREKADELFWEVGGIQAEGLVKRLLELYNQALVTTAPQGEAKNGKYVLTIL